MPIPRKPRDGPVARSAAFRNRQASVAEPTISAVRPGGALRYRAALSILFAIASREGRPAAARKRPAVAADDVPSPQAARGDDDLMSAPQDVAASPDATVPTPPSVDEAVTPHAGAPLAPAYRGPLRPGEAAARFRVF